jgi:CheY-like chemotaxis protein
MGIHVNWDNESETIIRYVIDGQWTWDEFEWALEKGFTMTETVSHTVDAILQFTETSVLPDGATIVWKRMMAALPANQGKVAFVGGNKPIQAAVKLFAQTTKSARHRIVAAKTLDMAYHLLSQQNPTLSTILIIEDEYDLREEIGDILRLEGYTTIQAANGAAGVELAAQHRPALILCDISMPKMDGYAVLLELRKNPNTAAIPFIFLTARTDRSFMRHGMELGADDYLTKPFTSSELLSAIKARLERQALTRKSQSNFKPVANFPANRED